MSFLLYLRLFTVLAVCLITGTIAVVGTDRLRVLSGEYTDRVRRGIPHFGVLVLVFVVNRLWRPVSDDLTWVFDLTITDTLYSIEGEFVPWLQSFATTELTWGLSFVYVFGYGLLLFFPLAGYLLLDDLRPFRVTVLAYSFNYLLGLVCYTLFVAYGPRNMMPGQVDGLMYAVWPQIEFLTTEVNANTNVFPSLHTSMSVTVAVLALQTRNEYPRWPWLAIPLALAVAFATMYLGLHWASDVVAGTVLGIGSVVLARRYAAEESEDSVITRTGQRLATRTRLSVQKIQK